MRDFLGGKEMHRGKDKVIMKTANSGKRWLVTVTLLSSLAGSTMTPIIGHAAVPEPVAPQEKVASSRIEPSQSHLPTEQRTVNEKGISDKQPLHPDTSITSSATADTHTTSAKEKDIISPAPTPTESNHPQSAPQEDESIDQWMPNKSLQQSVLYWLQQTVSPSSWETVADITKKDMSQLEKLYVGTGDGEGSSTYNEDGTPYSIQGLEYATNLEVLFLTGGGTTNPPYQMFGNLVDISPLKNLNKLQRVDLENNQIEDISPLANLKNITLLNLPYNRIMDFSSLKGIHYNQYDFQDQYLEPQPITVDEKARKAHLNFNVRLQDGSPAKNPTAYDFYYMVHGEKDSERYKNPYQGANVTESADGGLDFTEVKDQEPGIAEDNAFQLPDKYYLNAFYEDDKGYSFFITQPYKLGTTTAPVTVQYHDTAGQQVAPDATLTGNSGEKYTANLLNIPGYELDQMPKNLSGVYGSEPITVTFIYHKKATIPAESTVAVRYQDEQGHELAPTLTLTGNLGQPYTTKPVAITDYVLKKAPANATGTYGSSPITVTYVYTKLAHGGDGDSGTSPTHPQPPVNPIQPSNPGATAPDDMTETPDTTDTTGSNTPDVTPTPISSGAGATIQAKPEAKPTTGHVWRLPQTDEQRTIAFWLGTLILSGSLGAWWFKRSR